MKRKFTYDLLSWLKVKYKMSRLFYMEGAGFPFGTQQRC